MGDTDVALETPDDLSDAKEQDDEQPQTPPFVALVFKSPFTYLTVWGLAQAAVAIGFGPHPLGAVLGLVVALIGIGGVLYALELWSLPVMVFFRARTKVHRSLALAGVIVLVFISILFMTVYILNGIFAPPQDVFPASCEILTNCFRLTLNNNTNNQAQNLQVPFIGTLSLVAIKFKTIAWANSYDTNAILYEDTSFLHIRFISIFWGFADDFFLRIDGIFGSYSLAIQSASRVGIGDMGVNRARVVSFLGFMSPFVSSSGRVVST